MRAFRKGASVSSRRRVRSEYCGFFGLASGSDDCRDWSTLSIGSTLVDDSLDLLGVSVLIENLLNREVWVAQLARMCKLRLSGVIGDGSRKAIVEMMQAESGFVF